MANLNPDVFSPTGPWWVIVNPAGGNGVVAKRWPQVKALLDSCGYHYKPVFTEAPLHAVDLAVRGVEDGYRQIMAIGGDGTNNEVINGLMRQRVVPPEDLRYALIPIGTGNDWVRTVGIFRDFRKWIPSIASGEVRRLDVGLVHYEAEGEPRTRYFINVAGMAYDAFVVRHAEASKGKAGNRLRYLYLILRCLFNYDLRKARVKVNGQVLEDYFYTINVGLGRYSGGGMQFVPHARVDEGRFGITLAGKLSKLGVLAATPYFYNGKVARHPKVKTFVSNQLEVEAFPGQPPTLLEVDGEFLGQTPARFELLPMRLSVVVPAS